MVRFFKHFFVRYTFRLLHKITHNDNTLQNNTPEQHSRTTLQNNTPEQHSQNNTPEQHSRTHTRVRIHPLCTLACLYSWKQTLVGALYKYQRHHHKRQSPNFVENLNTSQLSVNIQIHLVERSAFGSGSRFFDLRWLIQQVRIVCTRVDVWKLIFGTKWAWY